MKKKFFAVALATTMALSTVISASAETVDNPDAFAGVGSKGYALKSGETLEFTITSKTNENNNYNAPVVVFQAAGDAMALDGSHGIIRTDAFGWYGDIAANGNKVAGNGEIKWETSWADAWADTYVPAIKDCSIELKIARNGNDIEMNYAIAGANGTNLTEKATFTCSEFAETEYVFLTGDHTTMEVNQKTAGAPADDNKGTTAAPADDNKGTTAAPADNKGTTAATTKAPGKNSNTAAQTGDVAPITALAAVAVVACAAVVVSRKKVTE